jgi:UDPglucose--hexose-1-phosphate uridylyltransferase
LQQLAHVPALAYALLFKNCGGGGGATVEHSHSQVLASTLVPTTVRTELDVAREFHAASGECVYCNLVNFELEARDRVVAATDGFLAICPYASRFPYETWVLPRAHEPRFERVNLGEVGDLSRLFRRILGAVEKKFPDAPHNYWIHTSPFDRSPYDHYHWHMEFIPRITTQAGFEWGTGCFVNPVLPEVAAQTLREALN